MPPRTIVSHLGLVILPRTCSFGGLRASQNWKERKAAYEQVQSLYQQAQSDDSDVFRNYGEWYLTDYSKLAMRIVGGVDRSCTAQNELCSVCTAAHRFCCSGEMMAAA